jgi:hypothetical protein
MAWLRGGSVGRCVHQWPTMLCADSTARTEQSSSSTSAGAFPSPGFIVSRHQQRGKLCEVEDWTEISDRPSFLANKKASHRP